MDRTTAIIGAAGALLLIGGIAVLFFGAQYGLEESLTVDGHAMMLTEDGYVAPSRPAFAPNETIEVAYTVENDRPVAWEGRIQAFADVPDGQRQKADHVLLDEQVQLGPGEEETFGFAFTPHDLGYASPRAEDYRGDFFTMLVQGPGPEHWLLVAVSEEAQRWPVQDDGFPVAETAAGASLVGIVLVALSEAGRYWIVRLLVVPLSSRLEPGELLENENRGAVLSKLKDQPGLHLRGLARAVDTPVSTVAYHLRRLEAAGFIESRRDGLKRRFFPAGADPSQGPVDDVGTRLMDLVQQDPGLTQAEAARRLGVSRQLVHHHLQPLLEEEAIRQEADTDGRGAGLYPNPGGATP